MSCAKDNRTLLWDLFSLKPVYELPPGAGAEVPVSFSLFWGGSPPPPQMMWSACRVCLLLNVEETYACSRDTNVFMYLFVDCVVVLRVRASAHVYSYATIIILEKDELLLL